MEYENLPEMYCPGCLSHFSLKVPAVFVPPKEPNHTRYSVCCPAAGLQQRDTDGLCHYGPYAHAIGADGWNWVLDSPEGGFKTTRTTRSSGRRVLRIEHFFARMERKWEVITASEPGIGIGGNIPDTTLIKEDFEWEQIALEKREGRRQ